MKVLRGAPITAPDPGVNICDADEEAFLAAHRAEIEAAQRNATSRVQGEFITSGARSCDDDNNDNDSGSVVDLLSSSEAEDNDSESAETTTELASRRNFSTS